MTIEERTSGAIELLRQLIAVPSLSREEDGTATILLDFLRKHNLTPQRVDHNIIVRSTAWNDDHPVVLLNSHHDTVKPAAGWQRDPFAANLEGDTLYGLGSNDAGASLVSLLATFLHLHARTDLPFNLLFVASAEEEISGPHGIAAALPELGSIDVAIVGEPTGMDMAIAEKGLMVIDGEAQGQSGHAAREEGVNALYLALDDIRAIRNYSFDRVSPLLGPTKATVTQIEAGSQHNVVPDRCRFVIDVRTNELYSNQEVHELLQAMVDSTLTPRSYRLNSSRIAPDHPLVQAGQKLGCRTYGSPTLSDQALMPFPSLKMGPGDSARSHTADEYILLSEIRAAIPRYVDLLTSVKSIPGTNS